MTDFAKWQIGKLQLYLRDHGITATGYRQADLAKIAATIENLQMPTDPDFTNDDLATTLKNRLQRAGCNFSDPFDLDGYTDDLSCLPDFSLYDIFNYLLLYRSDYDKRKLKAYKSAEDYRLFYDGHVEKLMVTDVSKESPVCVVKASVKPTQRGKTLTGKTSYQSWIIISKSIGDVKAAYCECTGGADGACRHIAACLYEIESFEKTSPTDGPCEWKKRPRAHDQPVPVSRLKILKPKRTLPMRVAQAAINNFDPRRPRDREADDDQIKDFANRLAKINPDARSLEFLPHDTCSSTENDLSESLRKLTLTSKAKYFKQFLTSSDSEVKNFVSSISFSENDVNIISTATVGQSSNPLWFDMRKGFITASHFHSILNNEDPETICRNIMGIDQQSKTKFQQLAMDWGVRKEPKARYLYKCAHGLRNCFTETGMVVNPKYPWVGCSPDGVVKCRCHTNRVVEFKCPFSLRNKNPKVVLQMKTNSSTNIDSSSQFYPQVQGQMGILEMDQCHLVFYTKLGIEHVTVDFDKIFFESMIKKLECFFIDHLASYLLKTVDIDCVEKDVSMD